MSNPARSAVRNAGVAVGLLLIGFVIGYILFFRGDGSNTQAPPPQAAAPCGSNGQPDCICKGDTEVTRIVQPGETIYVSAQGPTGFAPSPGPDSFALCNPNTGQCTTDPKETLQVNTTLELRSRSSAPIRMYCRYHS